MCVTKENRCICQTNEWSSLVSQSFFFFFFYTIEVCVSNALILHTKSPNHSSERALEFREELVSALVQGKCFQKDIEFVHSLAIPDIGFNRDHFHYPVINDIRSTCKVHLQKVKTLYSCAIFGVIMCPVPCLERYHTLKNYVYDDESGDGPWRLKEERGRP